MSFKKDGEVKVFKDSDKTTTSKYAQKVQYTVDDLVKDSDKEKTTEDKEIGDVSN